MVLLITKVIFKKSNISVVFMFICKKNQIRKTLDIHKGLLVLFKKIKKKLMPGLAYIVKCISQIIGAQILYLTSN